MFRNVKFWVVVLLILAVFVIGLWLSPAASPPAIPLPSNQPIPSAPILPPQYSVVQNEPGFKIIYDQPLNRYDIIIYGKPFEATRLLAEEAFLNKAGVSKTEACALNVSIITPSYINERESEKEYKLSFCEISPSGF